MWCQDTSATLSTVIDNGKQHFDMKAVSDNTKKCLLARGSLQGMTCYTSESTSVNFVLGVEHERANDATCSAALRLIKSIFSPSRETVMLNHVQAHMDRGCWMHASLCFFARVGVVT